MTDDGKMIQLSMVENVSTEPVSQKQMMIDSVTQRLDEETQEQVMPLLEAILSAQPTVTIKTYQQTQITMSMPRSRYEQMGQPKVGSTLYLDLKMT